MKEGEHLCITQPSVQLQLSFPWSKWTPFELRGLLDTLDTSMHALDTSMHALFGYFHACLSVEKSL